MDNNTTLLKLNFNIPAESQAAVMQAIIAALAKNEAYMDTIYAARFNNALRLRNDVMMQIELDKASLASFLEAWPSLAPMVVRG